MIHYTKKVILFFFMAIYFIPMFSVGWLGMYMKIDSSNNPSNHIGTTITLGAESVLTDAVHWKQTDVNGLVQSLFVSITPTITKIKPGDFFHYEHKGNYNQYIDAISDKTKQKIAQTALDNFRIYVNTMINPVYLDASTPSSIINTADNNAHTAATKEVYKQVQILGGELGVNLPDLNVNTCRNWISKHRKAIGIALLLGSGIFLYNYWNQMPFIIGTGTEACGTGVNIIGAGATKTGGWLQYFGGGLQRAGKYIKTPSVPKTPPAPNMPTPGVMVPAITPAATHITPATTIIPPKPPASITPVHGANIPSAPAPSGLTPP